MHICFLGNTKSVVQLLADFLSRRSHHSSFLDAVQGQLEGIKKVQLKCCKAMPYKRGKLGGWISESYVAMAKVIKWFYSDLADIAVMMNLKNWQSQWTNGSSLTMKAGCKCEA